MNWFLSPVAGASLGIRKKHLPVPTPHSVPSCYTPHNARIPSLSKGLRILGSSCTPLLPLLSLLRPVVADKIYRNNTGARRHRHLSSPELTLPRDSNTDGTVSLLVSENWEAYQKECGPIDYALSLTIGVHMSFYVQPVAPEHGCHPLMLRADASRTQGKAKDVLVAEDQGKEDLLATTSLPLGTFRFLAIADAFNAVDVDVPGETEYNIVTNNCAVLLFGVARELGIQLSSSDRAQIAQGLVQADAASNNKLANYVRDSGEIERSLDMTQDATNEQLLERLALRQIAQALDADNAAELRVPAAVVGVRNTRPRSLWWEEAPGDLSALPLSGLFRRCATAGLCYNSFQYSTRVQVGSIVFGTTYLGAEWRNIVSDIIVHTNFRKLNANNFLGGVGEYRNDCAMMKIEPVTNANLTPAVLNANGSIPVNGEILIVTAYGRISASGQYDASPGLRRTGQLAENTNCTFAFKSFQTSVSFCTSGPNRDLCEAGDYSAPLVDASNTVTGLLSSGKGPNLIARISGGLSWIQSTICKLSDFRGSYAFCPTVVCPADLTLLGQRNASVVGGAYLPTVTGSMLTPTQDSVTQFPAPGTLIQPVTTQKVLVTALDSANHTTNCTWYVRVPAIEALSSMTFTARVKNAAAKNSYSLVLPFTQNFLFLGVLVWNPASLRRRSKSVLSLTVKRENPLNSSDVKVLRTVQLKGTKSSAEFRVTARVPNPDNSTYRYVAYFNAQNIKSGTSNVQFLLKGQVKKM